MPTDHLPQAVQLREVGPRDGLQVEGPLAPGERAELILQLIEAGLRHIEAASFVSERAVPAMAGAAAVLRQIGRPSGVRIAVLVPNRRGAELALEHDIDQLTVTIAASAAYNEKNVRRTIPQSLAEIAEIAAVAHPRAVEVDAVISCAFGSPYEGDIDPAEVAALGQSCLERGAQSLTLADTTGMATPRRVREVLAHTGNAVGLHFHETRGTGLLNCYAALELGARRFDTALGGLGGSPFAAGAAGNLATEGAVALLDDLGVTTGISIESLLSCCRRLEGLVGHRLESRVALVGPRLALVEPG